MIIMDKDKKALCVCSEVKDRKDYYKLTVNNKTVTYERSQLREIIAIIDNAI